MNDSNPPQPRWYRLTPDRLLIALLPVLGLLWLFERFQWFPFNENKGWTVLIAVAVVCVAVVLLLSWFGVGLVSRRRFQFSIRSLLLLVAVVAVSCSWLAVEIRQVERQKEAVDAIVEARGDVWCNCEPSPVWLRELLGDEFFWPVADVRLDWVTEDAELERVALFTRLEELQVSGYGVNDASLEHLEGLTQLRTLNLNFTQVTDSGLEHLAGLTNLRWLNVNRSQVTEEGVKKLQEALPDCEIVR